MSYWEPMYPEAAWVPGRLVHGSDCRALLLSITANHTPHKQPSSHITLTTGTSQHAMSSALQAYIGFPAHVPDVHLIHAGDSICEAMRCPSCAG